MNWQAFAQFAMSAGAGGVAVALWLYGTGRLSGAKDATIDVRLGTLEAAQRNASAKLSELTSKILVLPQMITQLAEDHRRLRNNHEKALEHLSNLRVTVAHLEGSAAPRRRLADDDATVS